MINLNYLNQFYTVPEKDLALLFSKLKQKEFRKNEIIVAPGQIQKELFFVESGVQMSYFDAANKTHVIAFTYAPGICAIPESFSFQKPADCFLSCITESKMSVINYSDLQDVFNQSQEIERLFRKMTEFILAGMIKRHIELHSQTIEERFLSFCKRSPHLLQLVPHKYLASYLGIDPTNFSKLFNSVKI
ncbi:MAG: Crp/Fnr family transcriptional regulator [Crocinitomicaceae bacterium]|nr:Crp/Fnr family transcriptional regulator [Crocinitomicaceae bacterium]